MMNSFPADVIAAALASQAKWQIPASLTLAQWAVESAFGRSMPPGSNNPFGIKALPGQPFVTSPTSEDPSGSNKITGPQPFRKFASLADAFDAHGRLLGLGAPYRIMVTTFLNSARGPDDVDRLANALTGVYARALNYGSVLIKDMQTYDLYQYDTESPMTATTPAPAPTTPVPVTPAAPPTATPAPAASNSSATHVTIAWGSYAKDALVMLEPAAAAIVATLYTKYVPALAQVFYPPANVSKLMETAFASLEQDIGGDALDFDTHNAIVAQILGGVIAEVPQFEIELKALSPNIVAELQALGVLPK